jgi:hypothetical protein
MPTRMYLVELTKKKVLVEAASQEAAIRTATAKMVKSCTIPTPLEVARLMRDGTETIAPSLAPMAAKEPENEGGAGVGKLGLQEPSETEVVDEGGAAE